MNRDLLVLSNQKYQSPEQIRLELAALDRILFSVENWVSFSVANEVIDVNQHKIIAKIHQVKQRLQENPHKPFLFICNKN